MRLFMVGLMVAVAGCQGATNGSGNAEGKQVTGEDMTLREMAEKLERKGLKFKWYNNGKSEIALQFPDPKTGEYVFDQAPFLEAIRDGWSHECLSIHKYSSNKEARESAGLSKSKQSWGLFTFAGDEIYIKKAVAVLNN